MAKTSLKLKKNIGKEIVPILKRTGASAGGYVGGRYLNKMVTSPKIKPEYKGLGLMAGGLALQLVDNDYVEDVGKGVFIAGLQTTAESSTNAKIQDLSRKAGLLAGPSNTVVDEETDGTPVDWTKVYNDVAKRREMEDPTPQAPENAPINGGNHAAPAPTPPSLRGNDMVASLMM